MTIEQLREDKLNLEAKISKMINDFVRKHDIKKLSIDYDAQHNKKNDSYTNYEIGLMIIR